MDLNLNKVRSFVRIVEPNLKAMKDTLENQEDIALVEKRKYEKKKEEERLKQEAEELERKKEEERLLREEEERKKKEKEEEIHRKKEEEDQILRENVERYNRGESVVPRFCGSCGSKLNGGEKFCGHCGASLQK